MNGEGVIPHVRMMVKEDFCANMGLRPPERAQWRHHGEQPSNFRAGAAPWGYWATIFQY
jgi:hypothetical protein